MSLNPQNNITPQPPQSGSTVPPVTAATPRPPASSAPLSLKKEAPPQTPSAPTKATKPEGKREMSKEQRESLLVTRLLNLTDFLGLSKADLALGKGAVEKRLKALQALERKLNKHLDERERREQAEERDRTARKAMDLFLEGKGEDAKKLFQEYQSKYGEKKK